MSEFYKGFVSDRSIVGGAYSIRYDGTRYDKDDFQTLHQLTHANDGPGTSYYDPAHNPYQGPEDKVDQARADFDDICAKYEK